MPVFTAAPRDLLAQCIRKTASELSEVARMANEQLRLARILLRSTIFGDWSMTFPNTYVMIQKSDMGCGRQIQSFPEDGNHCYQAQDRGRCRATTSANIPS
jgi:hypothetical protein